MSLRRYVVMSLCRCVVMSLCRYVVMSLNRYVVMSLEGTGPKTVAGRGWNCDNPDRARLRDISFRPLRVHIYSYLRHSYLRHSYLATVTQTALEAGLQIRHSSAPWHWRTLLAAVGQPFQALFCNRRVDSENIRTSRHKSPSSTHGE